MTEFIIMFSIVNQRLVHVIIIHTHSHTWSSILMFTCSAIKEKTSRHFYIAITRLQCLNSLFSGYTQINECGDRFFWKSSRWCGCSIWLISSDSSGSSSSGSSSRGCWTYIYISILVTNKLLVYLLYLPLLLNGFVLGMMGGLLSSTLSLSAASNSPTPPPILAASGTSCSGRNGISLPAITSAFLLRSIQAYY